MVPAHVYFVVSAFFHYLGPSFAVLLFGQVPVVGVAWLRVASAAALFACWRRPWRVWRAASRSDRWLLLAWGLTLGLMNTSFYLAIAVLPLGTVGAIEFLGPILLAVLGLRSGRNLMALLMVVLGVGLLADVHLVNEPLGFGLALVNCALFVVYITLAHRVSRSGDRIGRLGTAMAISGLVVLPYGLVPAFPVFTSPTLLLAAVAVGVCSSVIPYVLDQLAMARLSRSGYALLLSLLPVTATAIGAVVLRQFPTVPELLGIAAVAAGVAVHRDTDTDSDSDEAASTGTGTATGNGPTMNTVTHSNKKQHRGAASNDGPAAQ